ncbi:MAG: tetratricopeptide repeat protein [Chthoniobacterales bacterium]
MTFVRSFSNRIIFKTLRNIVGAAICCLLLPHGFADDVVKEETVTSVHAPNWIPGYQVRYLLRVVGSMKDLPDAKSVLASLPTNGWLRPDGSDVVVQSQAGQTLPTAVLSSQPGGDTIVQFQRSGDDLYYWAYAMCPNGAPAAAAPIAKEGVVAEYRRWDGDVLDSWESIVKGLKLSTTVTGNAVVSLVVHKNNPARPDNPRNFAVSYRGYLNIPTAGVYKFFLNSDDAGFLFIDGYKVFEATGTRRHMVGKMEYDPFKPIELTAGVHTFEVHHIMGNSPDAQGYAGLSWVTPEMKRPNQWAFVPQEAYVRALSAQVVGLENAGRVPIPTFAFGVDDTLSSSGVTLYLAKFEAQGEIKDPAQLLWDFGDGTKGTGKSVEHIYFTPGEYKASLKSPAFSFPYSRTIYVYTAPVMTSPFSLAIATKLLSQTDWTTLDQQKINEIFDFLLISEQSDRWPLLEKLARYLIAQPGKDPQRRAIFYTTLMKALAEQGKGPEAIKLMDPALNEFSKLPSLQVEVMLTAADIYRVNMKDFEQASRLYEKLINDHRGVGTPAIREAAIHWGDLFAETGDMTQAEEHYRMAQDLGGAKFQSTGNMNAIQQGTLLRVAEQKLTSGDVRQGREMLERIEIEFPQQKLDGLYRFLRAEADRQAGRYEEAIRNYEVLIKLTQWASYRDRAFFGLADCYYRKGDYEQSLQWLDALQKSYPEYYEKQKLAAYRKGIDARIARRKGVEEKSAATDGRNNAAEAADMSTKGFETGFEASENQNLGHTENFHFVPMMGMVGPSVGLLQPYPKVGEYSYFKRLKNMTVNGNYWVEFWYRDWMGSSTPSVRISLLGERGENNTDNGSVTLPLDRTFGQWRKTGTLIKAPVTQDGILSLTFPTVQGTLMFDGLKILPVSDRENDSRRSFIQGGEAQ